MLVTPKIIQVTFIPYSNKECIPTEEKWESDKALSNNLPGLATPHIFALLLMPRFLRNKMFQILTSNWYTKVTSSRRAELLTTWRGSWMLEICGPIGTMRGCTGLIDDNLLKKNNQCSTHCLQRWNCRLKQVTSSKF